MGFEIIIVLLALGSSVGLFFLAWIFGNRAQNRHLESLREREAASRTFAVHSSKRPLDPAPAQRVALVGGQCVIGIDRFRQIIASLALIFGGRVWVFESAIDRARREAILRMKEQAKGADEICCLRVETSIIGSNPRGRAATVEAYAYGTALWR